MSILTEKYDIVKQLSSSQDNDVFHIRKQGTEEQFLLKTLKVDTVNNTVGRKIRFRHEMDIVSALDHPKIAKPVDTVSEDNSYSILYPYRKGETLAKVIRDEKAFSESDGINIALQILDALEYIHARGIVHVDINPYNIFVDDEKGIELLDFGISMTVDEAQKLPEGKIIGTIPYLAPEQMGFTDNKIDTRTDLYCTAIVLYRLLSGSLPFSENDHENSLSELLNATLKREVKPIKKVNAITNSIVLKALKPAPEDRYQTAEGLKADLRYAFHRLENDDEQLFVLGKKDAVAAVNRSRLFVARETEIAYLEKGYSRLQNKEFSSWLLYGRSGIGKTEIVHQFSKVIDDKACYFIPSKCNLFTPHQPYSILRHIVCEYLARIQYVSEGEKDNFKQTISEKLGQFSGVLCQTIPELKEYFETVGTIDKVEPEKEADRITHVLTTMVISLCEIHPCILFIDDLQWIDFMTFEICRKLMGCKPVCMLLFNYRTQADNNDLYVFGNNLEQMAIDKLLEIKSFNKDETEELIVSRFCEVKNVEKLCTLLFDKTEGNTFLLTEAMRFLVNNSYLERDAKGWFFNAEKAKNLPQKFDSVSLVLGKEEQLDAEEKRCLRLLSLIQGKFNNKLIEQFSGLHETKIKICLHRFENLGFINAHFRGGYSFSHDKIQELIANEIDEKDKVALYEQLAGLYEQLISQNGNNIFYTAECYLKTTNIIKAIDFAFKAAKYATSQIAFDVAIRYFKNTRFLQKQCALLKIDSPVEAEQIDIAFGDVLMLTGKNKQALTIFRTLLENGTLIEPYQTLETQYKIGLIYFNMGEFEKAVFNLKKLLFSLNSQFPRNSVVLVACLLHEIIKQILFSFGFKQLIKKRQDQMSELMLRTLNKLTYSLYFTDIIECLYADLKAINLADLMEKCIGKADAFTSHTIPLYQCMFKQRAFMYCTESLTIAEEIHRKDCSGFSLSLIGVIHYFAAHWLESELSFKKSIADFASLGDVSGQIVSYEHLWRISFVKGDLEKAISYINKTIELCTIGHEKHFFKATKAALYCVQYIQKGIDETSIITDTNELLKHTESFMTHSHVGVMFLQAEILQIKYQEAYLRQKSLFKNSIIKCFNSEYVVPCYSLMCELLLIEMKNRKFGTKTIDVDDSQLYKDLRVNFALLWFSCLSYPAYKGSYYRSKAWKYALQNKIKKAHLYFKKAISSHHSLDMKYEEARSIRDYGDFLCAFCKQPGDARDKYQDAYQLFDTCGAKLETDRLLGKLDNPHCSKPNEAIIVNQEEPFKQVTTTFSTVSGVNQVHVNTLYELSNSIQNIDDIQDLVKSILRSLINATGAQFGCFFIEGDTHHSKQSLFMDFEGLFIDEKNVAYSRFMVEKVAETKSVVFVHDGLHDKKDISSGIQKEIRSALCVPLTRGNKYLGCVYLGNNMVTRVFSEDSSKTAQIIAAQASVLLENAYLMDSYKKLNRDLQKKVREQTTDIREKNEQLEEYNVRVVESERMKGLLSGTLVHDIKNYVSGIEGNTILLSRSFPNEPKVQKMVNIVSDCCSGIVSLASNLLDIGKMEEGKLVVKKELITKREIYEMAENLRGNGMFEEKNISVTFTETENNFFEIDADYYLVDRVLQNLFSNASKYVPKNGSVILNLESKQDENVICLYNSGSPIPEADKTTLFDKYARLESSASKYSKGLGLFFCKMVMNAHGGRIWLDTDDKGNYFKLSFKKRANLSNRMTASAA